MLTVMLTTVMLLVVVVSLLPLLLLLLLLRRRKGRGKGMRWGRLWRGRRRMFLSSRMEKRGGGGYVPVSGLKEGC